MIPKGGKPENSVEACRLAGKRCRLGGRWCSERRLVEIFDGHGVGSGDSYLLGRCLRSVPVRALSEGERMRAILGKPQDRKYQLWARERESQASKRYTSILVAALLVIIPFSTSVPRGTNLSVDSFELATAVNNIFYVLAIITLVAISLVFQRRIAENRPWVEFVLWFIFGNLLIAAGLSSFAISCGEPCINYLSSDGDNGDLLNRIDKRIRSTGLWVTAAYASFAILIPSLCLVAAPRLLMLNTLAIVFLFLYDNDLYVRGDPKSPFVFVVAIGLFALAVHWKRERRMQLAFEAEENMRAQMESSDRMLASIIPASAYERLKEGGVVADSFSNVSVLFADLCGFTTLSRRLSPGHLVELLNEVFAIADSCATDLGLEKVKTIGDEYMLVAGGLASSQATAVSAVRFASLYITRVKELAERRNLPLAVRVGVHTGNVVGGVIGISRPSYDYWGDTVNIASRMQSHAPENGLMVSEATWFQVRDTMPFDGPEDIAVKGLGSTKVFSSTTFA